MDLSERQESGKDDGNVIQCSIIAYRILCEFSGTLDYSSRM